MGLYQVLQQCGPAAYRLQLPDILSAVHNVFHVSQLKKCLRVPDEAVEIEGIPLQTDLTYIEHPVKILDEKERVTKNNVVKFYKVQWQNHSENEATWEQQCGRDFVLGGRFVTPRCYTVQFLQKHCICFMFL